MPRFLWLAAILASSIAAAQQQVPSQNSPSVYEYKEAGEAKEAIKAEKKQEEAAAAQESRVTLSWNPLPRAGRYLLKISRDPELSQVFFTIETIQTVYVTTPLPPGQYYYQVVGYEGERQIGQTTLSRFVVAKPMAVQSTNEIDKRILPAPAIIGPRHLETFPAHGKMRMSWEAVQGARGYRFRLWDEDRIKENLKFKREIRPRWITEVEQPWIEFRDAPYASFMYLDSGTYRWDVAAINKDGSFVGDVATGYFKVDRQQYLRNNEAYMRFQYGLDPHVNYSESSAPTGQNNTQSSSSHLFSYDVDWWLGRQWGITSTLGTQSLDVQSPQYNGPTAGTLYYANFNLDLLFRTALSYEPRGWIFAASAGLGVQEYPQVDQIDATAIHVSRPREVGAHLGIRFDKRWRTPWELEIRGTTLLQAFTLNSPTVSGTTRWGFNGDLAVRMLYNWTEHFAMLFGLSAEYRRLVYLADPYTNPSTVTIPGWHMLIGAQVHFFADDGKRLD